MPAGATGDGEGAVTPVRRRGTEKGVAGVRVIIDELTKGESGSDGRLARIGEGPAMRGVPILRLQTHY